MGLILGIILRHGATALGTYMAAKGIIDGGMVEQFAGIAVAIGAGITSYLQKRGSQPQ